MRMRMTVGGRQEIFGGYSFLRRVIIGRWADIVKPRLTGKMSRADKEVFDAFGSRAFTCVKSDNSVAIPSLCSHW